MDSQSVKSTAVGGEDRGYDGGKKVKGRKRHILVDTEGFVLKAKVHSAKVMDYEGIKILLWRADERFPRLRHLWVDAGYRVENKGADWVQKTLGWSVDPLQCPRKPAPEEVMMRWAEGVGQRGRGCGLARTVAPQRLPGVAKEVDCRADTRLDRAEQEDEPMDYERSCASGEAFVYAAMIRLMARRLARV